MKWTMTILAACLRVLKSWKAEHVHVATLLVDVPVPCPNIYIYVFFKSLYLSLSLFLSSPVIFFRFVFASYGS